VGTGRVAMRLGETTAESAAALYEMWLRLGLGERTGVETASEAAGLVADPAVRPWHDVDLVNRAFGQGVAVTPLQLAAAFSAMVNGGSLPHPHVVAAANGTPTQIVSAEPVLTPALSDELRELMIHVVTSVPHYADTTLIPGYIVGGKTGTAQIWDTARGAWKEHSYNHTFAGFVGGERPEAVIIVRIHDAEPTVKRRFGYILELTSNELFRRVAQDVVEVLDLEPLAEPLPASPPPLDSGSVAGSEP
jgi:cell division protein FtsI (penicillin-binding protein 3)